MKVILIYERWDGLYLDGTTEIVLPLWRFYEIKVVSLLFTMTLSPNPDPSCKYMPLFSREGVSHTQSGLELLGKWRNTGWNFPE